MDSKALDDMVAKLREGNAERGRALALAEAELADLRSKAASASGCAGL
jgi:hypothetical protein